MMARRVGVAVGIDRAVAEVLGELRERAGTERISLHVALLPPLVQVRVLDLPPMSEADAVRVLARNPGRYFPDVREPQTIAVHKAPNGQGWLSASTPASVVTAIHHVARSNGWDVGAIVPAYAAWARVADGALEVSLEDHQLVMVSEKGTLRSLRRIRCAGTLPPALAKRRVIAADPAAAVTLAASHATRAAVLDLVPADIRAHRARAARRLGWAMTGASAALLLLAALLTLWGEKREVANLRALRQTLAPRVQEALTHREALISVAEKVNLLAALERSAEQWSTVVARVAGALPDDASLTAFRAEADSVSLEGQARDASGVFAAIRSAPGFLAVRASSPVRQEGGGSSGAPIVERFTMAARVAIPSAGQAGARP